MVLTIQVCLKMENMFSIEMKRLLKTTTNERRQAEMLLSSNRYPSSFALFAMMGFELIATQQTIEFTDPFISHQHRVVEGLKSIPPNSSILSQSGNGYQRPQNEKLERKGERAFRAIYLF